jgi:RNA-binding protein
MSLNKKQIQYLKGVAHSLKPIVLLGSNGLTEAVVAEIDYALNHHELIKVKIPTDDRETKGLIVEAICRETKATKVQVIGKTLVIYRESPEKKIRIPKISFTSDKPSKNDSYIAVIFICVKYLLMFAIFSCIIFKGGNNFLSHFYPTRFH